MASSMETNFAPYFYTHKRYKIPHIFPCRDSGCIQYARCMLISLSLMHTHTHMCLLTVDKIQLVNSSRSSILVCLNGLVYTHVTSYKVYARIQVFQPKHILLSLSSTLQGLSGSPSSLEIPSFYP